MNTNTTGNGNGNGNGETEDGPQPNLIHRTTTSIFRQTTQTSLSLLSTFLFLSLLLFSFRTLVQNGTVFLTSYIDDDPSLRSLLSRVDVSGRNSGDSSVESNLHKHNYHVRHRAFLHLTRAGTLDDDFFSTDDDDDRSVFGYHRKARANSSYLKLGFLEGNDFGEIVGTGVSFKIDDMGFNNLTNNDLGIAQNRVDFRVFMLGLELGRRETAALFFLVTVLSAAYGWIILGFVITYSSAFGMVFVSVVNHLLDRNCCFCDTVWNGSNLGVKRAAGFILMRWAVRDALTQVLGLWFFGEIDDQYSFFKLFLRLKLMPFSVNSPWVSGYEKEISGFLFAWFLVDSAVAFVFALDSWVTIVNPRHGGREIFKEGWYLMGTMIHQSIQLKCLELILCGAFTRWALARVCGRSIAVLLQSFMEVYFMVAWLIFYFAARSKDAILSGRRFGRRELEGMIEGLR